jgi:phospholipase C
MRPGRTLLRISLLIALFSLASACSGLQDRGAPIATSPCDVGPIEEHTIPKVPSVIRPPRVDASKFKTATPIKHVVFIMKENRTFDNLFGAFPGANGVRTGYLADGFPVDLQSHCFPQVLRQEFKHGYTQGLAHLNGGAMNGFGVDPYSAEWAYIQAQEKDIPNYWSWAQDFAISDNFFASVLGPSFPNHLYSMAATAHGTHDDPVPPDTAPTSQVNEDQDWSGGITESWGSWGCDSPTGTYVLVDSRNGGPPKQEYPCFKIKVMPDTLQQAGIPWAYYGASDTQLGYQWNAPDYIDHIRNDPVRWESHVFGVDQLIPDINDGHLPPVTWVTPTFWFSDHPGASLCQGENWTTEVVNALMQSEQWKDTAVFIVWDEWGGFYDHVRPPEGLGFRVPAMTISPYAKPGYIDKTQGDFSSILRFIENNWDLASLGKGEPNPGNDMMQNFDFKQLPLAPELLPTRHDCQGLQYETETPFGDQGDPS